MDVAKVLFASEKYPMAPGYVPAYGTAGFRARADLLPAVMFRCGMVAVLRSREQQQAVGVMVTASHNPEPDNGVKIIDPNGEYLTSKWEEHATAVARADDVVAAMKAIMQSERIMRGKATVIIGQDTRPSSPQLAAAVAAGVRVLDGEIVDMGLQTTPQLHFATRCFNEGRPYDELAYYSMLCTGFEALVRGTLDPGPLYVDCANGVGGVKMATLMLQDRLARVDATFVIRNARDGALNDGCGSEVVQKERRLPHGFADIATGARCCSIDGDADRIVYFTPTHGGDIALLDGDRIAALAACFITDQLPPLAAAGLPINVGVVQTAYANGASTAFIRDVLRLTTACTKTGVKHLHAVARTFDIGIYFEANGHGTILFSQRTINALLQMADNAAARNLLALADVVNDAVGDALSNILLVEAILRRKQWTLQEWLALYNDLPSRQAVVRVGDRNVIQTTDAETQCIAPDGLQSAIDRAVGKHTSARAFVRPSGTEDVVRVYAEAATQQATDALALEIQQAVHMLAGGSDEMPTHT